MSETMECVTCGKYNDTKDSSDWCRCPQIRDTRVSEDATAPLAAERGEVEARVREVLDDFARGGTALQYPEGVTGFVSLVHALLASHPPVAPAGVREAVAIIASEISDAIAAHDSGENVNAVERAKHVAAALTSEGA